MDLVKINSAQKSRIALIIFFFLCLPFQNASATTAFSRQTGEPCSTCHMQAYGPWLTPSGQKFKLDGYVAGNASDVPDLLNNFALEVIGSVTNTQNDIPPKTLNPGQYSANNNAVNDWTALYYTGRVTNKIGSYLQLNLSPQVGNSVSLAMADIRYANHATYKGNQITYGITVNNSPTMSDFWMTSYAWMYPYTQSSVTVKPAAQPWLQSLMAGANTAGATAYTMINNHLYLEGGAYTSQPQNVAQGLGVWNAGSLNPGPQGGQIQGAAPYWRVFLQHNTGPHNMMIGTYGLLAKVTPFYTSGFGTDTYEEYNFDANYSYMLDSDNMLMAMAKYTYDSMQMSASNGMGYANNTSNYLNSVMVMGMWTYKQTYNLAVGWNNISGSSDLALYNGASAYAGGGAINPITGSNNGSPNTNSFLFELDYVPFGKASYKTDPYINLRLSMQYWVYTQFNGSTYNYDGAGRNADANNTLYFVGNLMF